jgi:signal transduction histidine kinase
VRLKACEPGRRLLVVDDNPATLYSTSRVLRAAGFEVVEAASGEQALELLDTGLDLVVLDVNLPGIDGYEVCRRIRAHPHLSALPVVHLSASFIDERDLETGYDAGADGYLTHPVELPVLVGTINSFLRTRRAEAARRAAELERERLLARERAAREEAEHANALKDQFLAMLSHELRNPLNAVVGWAQVLSRRYEDPALQKGLKIITNAANAQAQLISDLLDVSRITAGKLTLDRESVPIAQVVASAIEAAESSARAKGIVTRCTMAAEAGFVDADPVRLQQVVWNLLNNAVKFTPEGGRIDVEVHACDEQVEVVVADTGSGMSAEFLPHVFEQFRQADTGSRKAHDGLGLGLAIVRLLVEAHGGSVSADSAGAGCGSTFRVRLPRSAPPPHVRASGPAPLRALPPELRDVRVLVVENDSSSRELIAALFGDLGATVAAAASVDEALEGLAAFDPQLLISDIGMPFRDGFDLIRAVRSAGDPAERLPAIALTAFASSKDRLAVLEAGFQQHIAKPIHAEHLLIAAWQLLAEQPG